MLLTPKGGSHRDLLPHQKTLSISATGGNFVKTEESTRNFTDSWKNNLLKQKKPNLNGIQCYDPLLNRDIIKHKGKEFEEHIKVDTTSAKSEDVVKGQEATEKQIDGNMILPTLKVCQTGIALGDKKPVDIFRYPKPRKAPLRLAGETSTPPNLNYINGSAVDGENSMERNLGALGYIETEVPKPLSPSALAQKLRRYKIGLSPKQKVKNLIDDMDISESNWERIHKEGVLGYEKLDKTRRKGEVEMNQAKTAREVFQNPFQKDGSFWNESSIDPGELKSGSEGIDTKETIKPKISDAMLEQINGIFPLMNRSQLEQLSNEDFLFLRQALREQGFVATEDGQQSIDLGSDQATNVVESATLEQNITTAPSLTDSTWPGSQAPDALQPNQIKSVEYHHELRIGTNDKKIGEQMGHFIYEDVSPGQDDTELLKPMPDAMGTGTMRVGDNFEDESSKEDEDMGEAPQYLSSNAYDASSAFHAPFPVGKQVARRMHRHAGFGVNAAYTTEENMNDSISPIAKTSKRGENKMPPYTWKEAELKQSRGFTLNCHRTPRCHHCTKKGELWCDRCQKVTCYNCWGIEDHHKAWEASIAFAADQGRLEKVPTMRGAQVLNNRKQAMEKTLQRVMSPSPQYSLHSGHNTRTRKNAVNMREAQEFTYSPSAAPVQINPSGLFARDTTTPKSSNVDKSEDQNGGQPDVHGVAAPYSVDASSGPDLFLTGLSAFSQYSQESSHGRERLSQGSESHQSRIILSARVPTGANAISQDDEVREGADSPLGGIMIPPDHDQSPSPQPLQEEVTVHREPDGNSKLQDIMPGESLELSEDGATELTANILDAEPLVPSPIKKPLTAMTDHLPDDDYVELQDFNSLAPSQASYNSQKIVSVINADQFYYQNAMSPELSRRTGEIQKRLRDTYIEYDDINAVHFSPAKKDPERVKYLGRIYMDKLDITAKRTKGYAYELQRRNARALKVTHDVKKQVHDVLAVKKELLRNKANSPVNQQSINNTEDTSIKIGKKANRLPLHLPDTSNPAEEAVEAFSTSPLNKKLIVPEINADGTNSRRPPGPREVFLQKKAEKKLMKKSYQNMDPLSNSGIPLKYVYVGVEPAVGDNDDDEPSATRGLSQEEGNARTRVNIGNAENRSHARDAHVSVTDESSTEATSPSFNDDNRIKEWGWDRMRGRSAHQGNFPSLPFRGPPYIFDMKADVHDNTIRRVFSPQEKSRTLSKLTSLW